MRLAFQHPWILIVMLSLVAAEFLWRRRRSSYDGAAVAASFGIAIGQALIRPVTGNGLALIFGQAMAVAPFSLPANDWRTWAARFLAVELTYYWFHRASHRIRWLWTTHSVHHSSRQIVLPSAIRLGRTEFSR